MIHASLRHVSNRSGPGDSSPAPARFYVTFVYFLEEAFQPPARVATRKNTQFFERAYVTMPCLAAYRPSSAAERRPSSSIMRYL